MRLEQLERNGTEGKPQKLQHLMISVCTLDGLILGAGAYIRNYNFVSK